LANRTKTHGVPDVPRSWWVRPLAGGVHWPQNPSRGSIAGVRGERSRRKSLASDHHYTERWEGKRRLEEVFCRPLSLFCRSLPPPPLPDPPRVLPRLLHGRPPRQPAIPPPRSPAKRSKPCLRTPPPPFFTTFKPTTFSSSPRAPPPSPIPPPAPPTHVIALIVLELRLGVPEVRGGQPAEEERLPGLRALPRSHVWWARGDDVRGWRDRGAGDLRQGGQVAEVPGGSDGRIRTAA
jgi:hypothetical protein